MINFSRVVVSAGKLWQLVSPVFYNILKHLQQFTNLGCRYLQAKIDDARFHPLPLPFSSYLRINGRKGFTLLELMMVIAILGTLAAIAVPNYLSFRERAIYSKTIQTMRMMEREIITFNIDNGRFPINLIEVGLDLLRDPWGNPYQYLNIELAPNNGMRRKNRNLVPINEDFDLYSMGPDGRSRAPLTARPSRDDIVRANSGGFLGRASNY